MLTVPSPVASEYGSNLGSPEREPKDVTAITRSSMSTFMSRLTSPIDRSDLRVRYTQKHLVVQEKEAKRVDNGKSGLPKLVTSLNCGVIDFSAHLACVTQRLDGTFWEIEYFSNFLDF